MTSIPFSPFILDLYEHMLKDLEKYNSIPISNFLQHLRNESQGTRTLSIHFSFRHYLFSLTFFSFFFSQQHALIITLYPSSYLDISLPSISNERNRSWKKEMERKDEWLLGVGTVGSRTQHPSFISSKEKRNRKVKSIRIIFGIFYINSYSISQSNMIQIRMDKEIRSGYGKSNL